MSRSGSRTRAMGLIVGLLAACDSSTPPTEDKVPAPTPAKAGPAAAAATPTPAVDGQLRATQVLLAKAANALDFFVGLEDRCPTSWQELVGPKMLTEAPVDHWGNALEFRCSDGYQAVISRGADAAVDTNDDLVFGQDGTGPAKPPAPPLTSPPLVEPIVVEGFEHPAGVAYAERGDIYYVTNTTGAPTERDGTGFISRVLPSGEVDDRKWRERTGEDPSSPFALNAPSGIVVVGGEVLVVDIDRILSCSGMCGPLRSNTPSPGRYLDIASDGGPGAVVSVAVGTGARSTGAIIHLDSRAVHGDAPKRILDREKLRGLGSLAVVGSTLSYVTNEPATLHDLPVAVRHDLAVTGPSVKRVASGSMPKRVGAIAGLADGRLFATGGDGAVYEVSTAGAWKRVLDDTDSVVDIAVDSKRDRLILALFDHDRVEIHPTPTPAK